MQPYTTKKINDTTYMVMEEYHGVAALPSFLLIGDDRAMVIDTGNGVGNLKAAMEEITDKPLVCYNTHAHLDHTGSNPLFGTVYMHPLEAAPLEEQFRTGNIRDDSMQRYEFVEVKCGGNKEKIKYLVDYAAEHMIKNAPYEIRYVNDGDVIDLGGRKIDVILVPGHTPGCLVYVDRKNKIAFGGDNTNFRTGLGGQGGITVAQYVENMKRMLSLTEEIEFYYGGHRQVPLTRQDVLDLVTCGEEIVAGCPGEPFTAPMGRNFLSRTRIHWYNGKRLNFKPQFVK